MTLTARSQEGDQMGPSGVIKPWCPYRGSHHAKHVNNDDRTKWIWRRRCINTDGGIAERRPTHQQLGGRGAPTGCEERDERPAIETTGG